MIRISHKDGSEYLLIPILFNWLLLAVCLYLHLNKTNSVEQHKVPEIKHFAHQSP